MPRPALTPEQRKKTRRLIQQAAADLYASNGSKDISVRAIAERAEVSVGTIYAYFDNLTELMQSLWKQPAKRLLAELEAIAQAVEEPKQRLRSMLETYANFAVEQRPVYRGAFLYVRPEGHDKPEPVALNEDRLFRLLQSTIATGQADGVFIAGDPNHLAQTLWAAVHGAIALPMNIDRLALDRSPERVQDMIDLMLQWLERNPLRSDQPS